MIKIKFINLGDYSELKIRGIENGEIVVTAGYDASNVVQFVRNEMFEVKYPYFFRATNDKDEIEKIKNGEFTHSFNHRDGYKEDGISVSQTLAYAFLEGYRYVYRVKGEVIAEGSDGEPVLDPKTMEFIDKKPLPVDGKRVQKWNEKYFEDLKNLIQSYGFTVEDFKKGFKVERVKENG